MLPISPPAEFHGMWENLVYDVEIKEKVLYAVSHYTCIYTTVPSFNVPPAATELCRVNSGLLRQVRYAVHPPSYIHISTHSLLPEEWIVT